MQNESKLMKINDLAEVFEVTDRTIKNWLKEGMPKYQMGKTIRFDLEEIKEWMKVRADVNGKTTN